MTDTITTTAPTADEAVPAETESTVEATGSGSANLSPQPSPTSSETVARECVDVDPTSLIIGDNVRAAAHLDRQFLASLREFGVMDPIHVTRADDGTLSVKRGQRRTLGAVKVGLPTVPVLIVVDDSTEAERIAKQWHENKRRDALTDTDRLAAVEQLTILGVPAGAIAKRLGTPRKVVDAAVIANASDVAKAAAAKHALTLTDAALIAEFEDNQAVIADILSAVDGGYSAEHIAQRARDARDRQQAYDKAAAVLTEAGVPVIDRPGHTERARELRDIRLVHRNGTPRKNAPTEAEHATCPGHAAYLTVDSWSTPPRVRTTYVCTDPTGNGHHLYSYNGGVSLTGQPTSGPMSEEQKAERRTVVANNRNWDSAEKVRRSWIADAFLTRTTPPKNAETFVALAVIHGERSEDYNSLYTTLTKAQSGYQATAALVSRAEAGTPKQALMLALALLVCEWESRTSRNTWRHPGERDRRYLAALVEWGYKPSDVEQLILTPPAAAPTDDAASVPADTGTEAGDGEVDAGLGYDADLDVHGSDVNADEDADGFEDAEGSEPEAWQDYGDV